MSVYMITFFVILTVYYGSLLSSFVQLSYIMYLDYVLLIGSVLLFWPYNYLDLSLRSHISVSMELLNKWNWLLIRHFLFPFALLEYVSFFSIF